MRIDLREHPGLLEQINQELTAGNTVEIKLEHDRKTDKEVLVVLRIDRKIRHREEADA